MRKIQVILLFALVFFFISIKSVFAAGPFDCGFKITSIDPPTAQKDNGVIIGGWNSLTFTFDLSKILPEQWDTIYPPLLDEVQIGRDTFAKETDCGQLFKTIKVNRNDPPVINYTIVNNQIENLVCGNGSFGDHILHVLTKDNKDLCTLGKYSIANIETADIQIKPVDKNGNPAIPDITAYWDVNITNLSSTDPRHLNFYVDLDKTGVNIFDSRVYDKGDMIYGNFGSWWPYSKKSLRFVLNPLYDPAPEPGKTAKHSISVYNSGVPGVNWDTYIIKTEIFEVFPLGKFPSPTLTLTPTPTPPDFCTDNDTECNTFPIDCRGRCKICNQCLTPTPIRRPTPKVQIPNLKPLCDQLPDKYSGACWDCQRNGEIWSAIGCLPTNFSDLINKYVFTTGVGIAGGIAFLYFLYGAFLILTSSGNAEKMEEAKQIITSSLAGLLLIIFSVFLLKVIGVDILGIPEFGPKS